MDGAGKAFAGVVAGVIIGFLLGGAGPRREAASLRKENETLGDELLAARKKAGRQSVQFLPLPQSDSTPRPVTPPAPAATDGAAEASPAASPEDFKPDIEQFRIAMDAQKIRIRQSREVLKEKTKMDAGDERDLDAILAKMNEDLAKHAELFADAVLSGEEPEPMDMLGMTHEVTGILLGAQKAYQDVLGPDFEGLDESTASVWNFVDLSYFQTSFEQAAQNLPQ
jgi:hypothetical protein